MTHEQERAAIPEAVQVDRIYHGIAAPAGWRRLTMAEMVAGGSPKYNACRSEADRETAGLPEGAWWLSRRSEWWFRVCALSGSGQTALPFMVRGTVEQWGTYAMIIDKAARLAAERHAGQFRKGPAGAPYITHCGEVAALVAEHGGSEAAIAAAWLHDTVEDTDTTLAEIEERFGAEVAGLVSEVTDDPSLDKAARQAAQVASAPHKSPGAAMIKAGDQTSNMCGLVASPPDWSAERRRGYIAKCRAVVEGLNIPAGLRQEFEAAVDAAER